MQNGDNNDDDPPPGNESNTNDTHSDNDDDESGNISAEDVVLKNYQVQETKIKYPDAFLLSDQVTESFNGMFKLFFSVNVEYPTIDPFFNQT